jgi:hypothetical protein
MPYGSGSVFRLVFYNCIKWREVDDLLSPLIKMLTDLNLRVLTLPSLSPLPLDVSQQILLNFLKSNYEAREGNWDENYYPVHADGGLTLRINVPFLPFTHPRASNHLLLNCSIFGQEYNSISFSINMHNRIHDEKYVDIHT